MSDDPIAAAAYGVGGELQMAAYEVGFAAIAESDLRSAMRRALQMQFGRRVDPEARIPVPGWAGRVGKVDIGVRSADAHAPEYQYAVELKWCREDTFYELLWDALKLASIVAAGGVERAYLVVGGPRAAWARPAAASELATGGSWQLADLLYRNEASWRYLLGSTKTVRPHALPTELATMELASVVIQRPSDEADWLLRVARVTAGETTHDLVDGWPVDARIITNDGPEARSS